MEERQEGVRQVQETSQGFWRNKDSQEESELSGQKSEVEMENMEEQEKKGNLERFQKWQRGSQEELSQSERGTGS